ncbi:MAG: ABC transporter ATP-binding protein [Clostridia bacterium]|nr:ABC transporter ATP-binding protein [Clostridia bacterium]
MQKNKIGLGQYFGRYKFGVLFYILTTIFAGVCSIFVTVYTAKAIEVITFLDFEGAVSNLLIVLGITVMRRLSWWASGALYDTYSVKIMADLNNDLAKQAFKLNSRTFTSHDTGTFVQRIVSDPEKVVNSLADIVNMVANIITSFAMVIYIAVLNVYVGLIVFGLVAVSLLIEMWRLKCRRRNRSRTRAESDKITTLTTEIVRSEKDIKSLGLETKLSEVSAERYGEYKKAVYKGESDSTKFWIGRSSLIEVVSLFLLMFAISLMEKSVITLATFMIIHTNQSNINGFIWDLAGVADRIVDIKVSSNRMFALFDEYEFVTERFGEVNLPEVKGDIEFKNVNFSFKEFEYETDKKTKVKTQKLVSENRIFEDLSFKIPRNTTVAFVGKSGSGKSTILNLIAKMMEVDSGEILIDNTNVNSLDKETLRKTFSLVNQFPYIFDMTIKENLLLAKSDATDEEILHSLKLASLAEFVDGLPKGIDTKVGESGIKLSGGQKQRLAIARAMLRKSAIILFDESTSSLDNFAQEEVKRSIDGIKGTSTIVIVAHRLSTIKDSDIIFFLDNGKIIDSGTFDDLYATNEKFKRMFLAENIDKF